MNADAFVTFNTQIPDMLHCYLYSLLILGSVPIVKYSLSERNRVNNQEMFTNKETFIQQLYIRITNNFGISYVYI